MSMSSVDLFECDRCGTQLKKERNEQPADWASAYVVWPPKKSPMEPEAERTILCFHCRNSLRRWLREAPPLSTEGAA